MDKPAAIKIKPLDPARIVRDLAGIANMEYRVTPLDGTAPDDLLNPSYWVHKAKELRQFDRISAIPDDQRWYAQYLVLEVGTGYARLVLLWKVDIEPAGEALPLESPVEVQFKGPHLKHVVVRKSDHTVLKDGIARKIDAEAWARDYATRIAA